MDILKKIMIALSAALILWGCSDDDESTDAGNATISLSTGIIQVDRNGGDATVTVTSSGDWRLSGVCDWAHPSMTSGKNGDVVTFTIDPNTLVENRSTTFKFFTGSAVVPLQIESAPAYIMDLLSESNLSISKDAHSLKIQLNTNVAEPTITFSDGGEQWLTLEKRSDFGGKVTFSFTAAKNETYKERSSTITLSSPLVSEPVNVQVTQKQTDAIIVENNRLMYDFSGRTISFTVKYNVDYNISIIRGSEWITGQSVSEPQTGEDGLSTVTLSYTLGDTSITRGGIIRITSKDGAISNEVTIVQKDPDVVLVEILDSNLRSICFQNNWILPIAGSQCAILEAGLNATSFSNSSYSTPISDLTGIENFPNLTSLKLGSCSKMKKMDISGLHKVSELSYSDVEYCGEYNFGNNPITSFEAGGTYSFCYSESLKITSDKLESIDLSIYSFYAQYYDKVTSIDVSGCPALTTLNADRGSKVKTLYLKKGQTIPNLTKNDATEIVYK